jgi:hypothetical protein
MYAYACTLNAVYGAPHDAHLSVVESAVTRIGVEMDGLVELVFDVEGRGICRGVVPT